MILVTGASGNVGASVCLSLSRRGVAFVEAVTNQSNKTSQHRLDFLDSRTFNEALEGISKVFLVRPPALAKPDQDMLPFLKACKAKQITQIVFLSLQGVEHNSITPHAKIESLIKQLELPYTFLRPSFFMQNLTMQHKNEIKEDDVLFIPAGRGKTNFIDARDIAEVAALVLSENGHNSQAYELTGETSYNYDEVATMLSEQLGRKIRYARPGFVRYLIHCLRKGMPVSFSLVTGIIYTVARLGKADHYSPEMNKLLARKPTSLAQFIAEHSDQWKKT
jgi:uncharacterized protein YbjT (DUF2867 family)